MTYFNLHVLVDPSNPVPVAEHIIQIGTELAKNGLVITRFLGRGSVGNIYEAKNQFGKVFAVKMPAQPEFKVGIQMDANCSNYIRQYMSVAEQKSFELGRTDTELRIQPLSQYLKENVFIMKKKEGDFLNLMNRSDIFLPPAKKQQHIQQMTNMLYSLHKLNLVCPDFKAENILYDKKNLNLKLTDLSSVVPEREMKGQSTFIPPEIAIGGNWRSDNTYDRIVPHTKQSDSFILGLAILRSFYPGFVENFAWYNVHKNKSVYPQKTKEAQDMLYDSLINTGYDVNTAQMISNLLEYAPKNRTDIAFLSKHLNRNQQPNQQIPIQPQFAPQPLSQFPQQRFSVVELAQIQQQITAQPQFTVYPNHNIGPAESQFQQPVAPQQSQTNAFQQPQPPAQFNHNNIGPAEAQFQQPQPPAQFNHNNIGPAEAQFQQPQPPAQFNHNNIGPAEAQFQQPQPPAPIPYPYQQSVQPQPFLAYGNYDTNTQSKSFKDLKESIKDELTTEDMYLLNTYLESLIQKSIIENDFYTIKKLCYENRRNGDFLDAVTTICSAITHNNETQFDNVSDLSFFVNNPTRSVIRQMEKERKIEKQHIKKFANLNPESRKFNSNFYTKYEKNLFSAYKNKVTKELNEERDAQISNVPSILEINENYENAGRFKKWRMRRAEIKAIKNDFKTQLIDELNSYKLQLKNDRKSLNQNIQTKKAEVFSNVESNELTNGQKLFRVTETGRKILKELGQERGREREQE